MSTDVLAAFGERIRSYRLKRGWSQEELAHRAEMDVSYLSDLERGRKEPCLLKMKKLAAALNISLPEMVKGL